MDLFFGLPSLRLTHVAESWGSVTATAQLLVQPECPRCPGVLMRTDGRLPALRVTDLPSRGKPTFIDVERSKFKCHACGKALSPRGPDLDPVLQITRRAKRQIERAILHKRPSDIAEEMGFGRRNDRIVREIAKALAARLRSHRLATPLILGVDDLALNDVPYTVFTDGRTGKCLGLSPSRKAAEGIRWIDEHVISSTVRVIVTDLARQNFKIAKDRFSHALHVADKWHVIRLVNKAVQSVINNHLDELEREADAERRKLGVKRRSRKALTDSERLAANLKANRSLLAGFRDEATEPVQLEMFGDRKSSLAPIFDRFPAIEKAYKARVEFYRMYQCRGIAGARQRFASFLHLMRDPLIAPVTEGAANSLQSFERPILNYFRAIELDWAGTAWAPTNGPTERRNQSIRGIWENSRGLGLDMLNLRAAYGAFHLDVDLIECAACGNFEGPLPGSLESRLLAPVIPLEEVRCSSCISPSLDAAEPPDVVRLMVRKAA